MLAQSAAVVSLIVHYHNHTVKGIWTHFQCYILNDAKTYRSDFYLFFFFIVLSLSTQRPSQVLIKNKFLSTVLLCRPLVVNSISSLKFVLMIKTTNY